MNCIDTHIHVWNFSRGKYAWLEGNTTILARNYLIEELEPRLPEAGVTEGVLVQAACVPEDTLYMLEVAEQRPWLKGVVGWLPLLQPSEVEKIFKEGYATHSLFKGVRHLIHDEPDPRWLLQEPVIESLQMLADANLPYDVVGVLPEHLQTLLEVLNKVPSLCVVLDHLNAPPIPQNERFGTWGEWIKELSQNPNAHAKISGLGTVVGKGAAWTSDDIKPYVEFVLKHFGVDRCFCGGDWPVSLLADDYVSTWKTYRDTLASLLSEEEQQRVLYNNAKTFYKL